MWYAAGNTSSYEMAAHKGLGVLGLLGRLHPRPEAVAGHVQEDHRQRRADRGLRQRQRDGATAALRRRGQRAGYQKLLDASSTTCRATCSAITTPSPTREGVPYWPDLIPDLDLETVKAMAEVGAAIVGDPDQALEQCRRWEAAGCDQISFGVSGGDLEASLETIRLLGSTSSRRSTPSPLHSTTRYRQAAAKS